MCAAILFDLDGVLVDSATLVERTWRRWALEHDLDPEHVLAMAHGRRTQETVALVAPHLSAVEEGAALSASEAHTTDGIHEISGARELVEKLPRDSWAIVTSGTRAVATTRIRHTGLPMPDVLICADEIARGKPDPEGYLAAAHQLGVSPARCVVIEDAPAGLEAARAGGMRSIGVIGTYPAEALAIADHVVENIRTLNIEANSRELRIEIGAA